ncbi:MAG: hypothetical protein LBU89_06395 [Fibromonadaceae bacterium]|jgi:hypothetical protein|nr:hypothetical protein [Fibromonadaceae bacterium]
MGKKIILPILLIGAVAAQAFPHYEAFLDSMETYANAMLPEKERIDSLKAIVNAETISPKDEFEKQTDYEKRLADSEKEKQQKILALKQDYQNRTKETMDKLKAGITSKNDIQPNWEGILKKDGDIEEYRERINKITDKISEGTARNEQITGLFTELDFEQKEAKALAKHWFSKKQTYITRLQKARELMQDYIIQEQTKILTTDRQKFEMSLGAYNADKEEFEFSMNDADSKTVPFDFSGTVKISPQQARETNRQTEDFTASIGYINFPLITDEATLYPGVKKANVFYKDQELKTAGLFKIPPSPGLSQHSNFREWAIYADSLLTGKLAPRNLDSLYAMSAVATKSLKEKKDSGPSLSNKAIFRIAMFGLSATSLGIGLWHNSQVDSNVKKASRSMLEYSTALNDPSATPNELNDKYEAYRNNISDLKNSEDLRAAFYIGAGVFGTAGILSFFF